MKRHAGLLLLWSSCWVNVRDLMNGKVPTGPLNCPLCGHRLNEYVLFVRCPPCGFWVLKNELRRGILEPSHRGRSAEMGEKDDKGKTS